MKPKHKQSSLLAFFKKPKASNVSDAPVPDATTSARPVENPEDDNIADDENDAIIEPSSPHGDEKVQLSSVVSPAVVEGSSSESDLPNAELVENKDDANNSACASVSSATSHNEDSNDEIDNVSDDTTPKKSEYELLRERNIARNNARLKSLGLLTDADCNNTQAVKPKRAVKRKKAGGNADVISYPTRRSTRMRKAVLGDEHAETDHTKVDTRAESDKFAFDEVQDIQEEQYTTSALFEYNMNDTNPFSQFAYSSGGGNTSEHTKLVPFGPRLVPPSGLNAIYSLEFFPHTWESSVNYDNFDINSKINLSWLVGAGKSGIVALWDCRKENSDGEGIDPIVSWKAHGGRWIADARFLPATDSSDNENTNHVPKRLLTAANDGTICHWDLTSNSVKTGAPKLLGQTNKSLHSSGIFSMDVRLEKSEVMIASGSKDKSIALSNINRFGEALWRSNFHSAKVGCVSLSSGINPFIASASDDGYVAIHDSRMNGLESTAVKIENAHFKPHSALWQPGSDSVFLSAGLNEEIKLWDVRNVVSPLAVFRGHVPKSGKKMKRIHRPAFMRIASESFILSGGEGSSALSMFQLDNLPLDGSIHSVFNRGKLPGDIGSVGSLAVSNNAVAVSGDGGEVLILLPKA